MTVDGPCSSLASKSRSRRRLALSLLPSIMSEVPPFPGLAAKPEIDLLVEVAEHRNESSRDNVMRELGYARGSNLSAGHHFYRRDVDGVRTHKTHVCITGHGQIERMLRFRDLLRDAPVIRQQYQEFKLELEASNTGGIGEYLARKAPFIEGLMGSAPTSARRGAAGCDTDCAPSR